MGRASDPMAVVDPECRVIGVEGLRVADSSIFPQVTNGNLNGPSIMTGRKGGGPYPGPHAAAGLEPGALDQPELADGSSAVELDPGQGGCGAGL
jgi:choline dehydrogenase-like flavoprotein